jgi:hypothetical protein
MAAEVEDGAARQAREGEVRKEVDGILAEAGSLMATDLLKLNVPPPS